MLSLGIAKKGHRTRNSGNVEERSCNTNNVGVKECSSKTEDGKNMWNKLRGSRSSCHGPSAKKPNG